MQRVQSVARERPDHILQKQLSEARPPALCSLDTMLDKLRMEEFSTGFRTRVNEIRHKLQRNGGSLCKHVAGDSGHSAQTSQPPKSHYSLRKKLLWRQFCEDVKKEDADNLS